MSNTGSANSAPSEDKTSPRRFVAPAMEQRVDTEEGGADQLAEGGRPAKLTGADLEARLRAWGYRAEDGGRGLLERAAPARRFGTGRTVLVVVLLGALAGSAVGLSKSESSYSESTRTKTEQIRDLEADVALQQITKTDPAEEAQALAALSAEAGQAADAVAAAQQRFAVLAHQASTAPSQGNGAPAPASLAAVEHRRTLAQYWSADTLIVPDEQAYRFDTAESFEPDRIDPRYPWFTPYDAQGHAPDAESYRWTTELVMPAVSDLENAATATGSPSSSDKRVETPGIDVLWTCRDRDGALLAWASASYDGTAKKFGDLRLVITTQGQLLEGGDR